ncbi:lactadherin-like [Patiria miniata]|uniref:F5/8 type C domain-containing protein n=1 Tax=Patiria miniata TaxID=46514 RepID=A0A914ABC7_PATMI|nr:lactadherin-like [Patiria miniata]
MVSCHQVCFIGSEYIPQSGIPPRWFLLYKDPCECTAIRLGGMRNPASSYSQRAPYYLNELFLSEDSDEIKTYFTCSRLTTVRTATAECPSPAPLGVGDRAIIPDDRIRASSSDCCPAVWARLNDVSSGWSPAIFDNNAWIEVDLVESTVVSGVTTQGHYDWYVTEYKVVYKKLPSSDYEPVTEGNGNVKVFIGNINGNTPVTNFFEESLVATVVRIETIAWVGEVTLKFELLGCRRG